MTNQIRKIGQILTKDEQKQVLGGNELGNNDEVGGFSVTCVNGMHFVVRGKSNRTAAQLCENHLGVASIVLLP